MKNGLYSHGYGFLESTHIKAIREDKNPSLLHY